MNIFLTIIADVVRLVTFQQRTPQSRRDPAQFSGSPVSDAPFRRLTTAGRRRSTRVGWRQDV